MRAEKEKFLCMLEMGCEEVVALKGERVRREEEGTW